MTEKKKVIGLLAQYDSPSAIYHAAEKVRDAGFKRFDSFTPFPVHGLDKAMGLGPSYLPWLVLVAGTTGALSILFFMIWASAYDYPLNIGGKPTWSIPAFIPITFEVTVLLSGLTSVFGMFFLNSMPKFYHPLFGVPSFRRVTDDGFFILIEAHDKFFDIDKTRQFLQNTTHASSVVLVED